ncbi:MAG: hypothetical protein E6700_10405 [Winkia neuii]|uniref:Uncharacterized protein n=2 Tax=Winkia neuii TaxID=33007 RepID=A0A2I1IN77_9ACTO|nr:hypothetical protein [Winkia neuii]MDK8100728.1 hypothetical protein [Winkia neuii]MDU3135956.1 hypothetical protein [Winkia neuii]OFT57142.1 hypothetical protein HMPREF3152_00025 [Actinomyces sp. HMSC06A08]PKY72589.1 hypothetical protein CYJ19_07040 [Winkia neuii]
MADLKVDQANLDELQSTFHNIHQVLSLRDNEDMEPTKENVGHRDIIRELVDFNTEVQKTRNKYEEKVKMYGDYLGNVSRGTTEADNAMAQAATGGHSHRESALSNGNGGN